MLRTKVVALTFLTALAVSGSMSPAKAAGVGTPGLAVPGSFAAGFATPQLVSQVGGMLLFVNLDIQPHDITHLPPDGRPRLFHSATIGAGQVAFVEGLENIQDGQTYQFFCTVHPTMKGTLTAIAGV